MDIEIAINILKSHDLLEQMEELKKIIADCHCADCNAYRKQPVDKNE